VNLNRYEPKQLREVMAKEKLNWRSFADQGAINAKWNAFASALYVIDHQGAIRYKWLTGPGEHAIDAALAKLIPEAEGKNAPK
jgi:hypothetical protein